MTATPLLLLGSEYDNQVFVKHEELYPFSFGGNKARIVKPYFEALEREGCDCVVTYGGAGSNLCRVTANMAAARGIGCVLVMHDSALTDSLNRRLAERFGARIVPCAAQTAGRTIDDTLQKLRREGFRPFFISGGGNGLPGTQAYVDCYREIEAFERLNDLSFDYIFLPSGTGTTQAGLVCGRLLAGGRERIVGISISRPAETGRPAVLRGVKEFLAAKQVGITESAIEDAVIFEDAYTGGGYGRGDHAAVVDRIMRRYGMPLDEIYTGKAFAGMGEYLKTHGIKEKNILFINTGSVPLYFDALLKTGADAADGNVITV